MQSKSVLVSGPKDVDKRTFAIALAEFLASQNYTVLIITKSFDYLPEPWHGKFRDSDDYAKISLRYPKNIDEFAAILFDFSLFRKLSKGHFTIIAENIEDFCTNTEEIARLVACLLGSTPYLESQIYPKLIVTHNTDQSTPSTSPLSCLFDSIWETAKSGNEVSLSMQGRGKVCFEELTTSTELPQIILRLKSILKTKLK